MYNHVLVPLVFDHEKISDKSISLAQKLLNDGGHISLLHIMEEIPAYAMGYVPDGTLEANSQEALSDLKKLAAGVGEHCSATVLSGHSHRTILDYSAKQDVDCIVIASHKPGLEDYFLGSTAGHVVRHADCCVHVLR